MVGSGNYSKKVLAGNSTLHEYVPSSGLNEGGKVLKINRLREEA